MLHGNARGNAASSRRVPEVERKDPYAGPAAWDEPRHGLQVALSHDNHSCMHGPEATQKHSAFSCRGSCNRGVQANHALPMEDLMGHLRASIAKLTCSSPRRCLLRHGISRLSASDIKCVQQCLVLISACSLNSVNGVNGDFCA